MNDDIVVNMREGVYYQPTPHVLDQPGDCGRPFSGTCSSPGGGGYYMITYRPETEGDEVTIHGGASLANSWTVHGTIGDNTVRKQVINDLAGWPARDLYYKNRRLTRARYPNTGFMHIQATGDVNSGGIDYKYYNVALPVSNTLFPSYNTFSTDNVTELVGARTWTSPRAIAAKYYATNSVCSPPNNDCDQSGLWCASFYFTDDHPFGPSANYVDMRECDLVYLENRVSFIDTADEWCFDAASSTLYVCTPTSETFSGSSFVFPLADELVWLDGVHHIAFEDINFAFTKMNLPTSGYHTNQSGYGIEYSWTGDDNPTNCDTACIGGCARWIVPGAVYAPEAHACSFTSCRFMHLGGSGIEINGIGNTIESNKFEDISGSAVVVLNGCDLAQFPYCPPNEDPCDPIVVRNANNSVSCNLIKHIGRVWHDCPAIQVGLTLNCEVMYNEIEDTYWSGIALGQRHDYMDMSANNNKIVGNKVTDCGQWLGDSGGIYVLGRQVWPSGLSSPKNVPIRSEMAENYIVNAATTLLNRTGRGSVGGILFDSGSIGWDVGLNVLEGCDNSFVFNVYCVANCGNNTCWCGPACPGLQSWVDTNYVVGTTLACLGCTACDSGWPSCAHSICTAGCGALCPMCGTNCQPSTPSAWSSGNVEVEEEFEPNSPADLVMLDAGIADCSGAWEVHSTHVDPPLP